MLIVFNQIKVRYFRIILPFESRGNFFLPLLFGIDSGWSELFVFDAWGTFFDFSGVFFLVGGWMARAYVTWKSTRCLSLSSGAKLAKYESRVAFELGLGTCSPDVWALSADVWAISADVWAFLVTATA